MAPKTKKTAVNYDIVHFSKETWRMHFPEFVHFIGGGLQFYRSELSNTVHLHDFLFIILTAGVLSWYSGNQFRKASIGEQHLRH